ncbi:sigma-70 family RNA polymerase sigma factor [Sphingomonas gei]|uniref:Sigma-70 family RNA polymerase sigma factor n=1 Tax=Sphingomonas gei TaxID=1395960 RepID=A0A4S1X027_9SPHN|nr:sigma-70 family RNA polymerase sigma factor [Sphingomonas gei]TGX49208.1 sigma-70 family RNA polymerase sigma factor [Sphingomonas gei]
MSRQEDVLSIFLTQRQALVRYASGLTGNRAEAEDVVQEAWLRFHAVAGGRLLAEPERYLRRIVRNLIVDGRRRKGLEQRLFDPDSAGLAETLASEQPSALTEIAAREELEIVRKAVAAMPERMRRAFEMHRFEGARLVDIAASLSISKSLAHELVVEGVQRCKRSLRGER